MNNTNKINEITKRLSEISLNISRVPSNTKREFISLANAEFSGDYGMLLKNIFDDYLFFNSIKKALLNNNLKITFENGRLILENGK